MEGNGGESFIMKKRPLSPPCVLANPGIGRGSGTWVSREEVGG